MMYKENLVPIVWLLLSYRSPYSLSQSWGWGPGTRGAGQMTHFGLNHPYEVTLGPAAIRTVLCMAREDRRDLAEALRTELLEGPNAGIGFRFDSDIRAYTPGQGRTGRSTRQPRSALARIRRSTGLSGGMRSSGCGESRAVQQPTRAFM